METSEVEKFSLKNFFMTKGAAILHSAISTIRLNVFSTGATLN